MRLCNLAKDLLAHRAAIAPKLKSWRMQWEVLDWNLPATKFYG